MKILFISMPSIHAIRWIENLKNTNNELFWFDVTNKGAIDSLQNVTQFVDWKQRKLPIFKGEYKFSKKIPNTYSKVKHIFEVTENEALEKIINEVQPDVIHSFEMHYCTIPVINTLNKFKSIPLIYSCWGSDFFNHLHNKKDLKKIKKVLLRVNYLITDCDRDHYLATVLNFKGHYLGVFPGGGGYEIEKLRTNYVPISDRKVILVKGYENFQGRAINVMKALDLIIDSLGKFDIVVFSKRQKVVEYVEKSKNLKDKIKFLDTISNDALIKIMGTALIYIGNSTSDGMPNTLIESMIMGAFPIQSNPGNVTSEIITNFENGLLINDAENVDEIKNTILSVLNDSTDFEKAASINYEIVKKRYEYYNVQRKINDLYNKIQVR